MANYRERTYRDFEIDIGDRVEFRTPHGEPMRGRITGRGAAGFYLEIRGDDGIRYSANSSDDDLHKIFRD